MRNQYKQNVTRPPRMGKAGSILLMTVIFSAVLLLITVSSLQYTQFQSRMGARSEQHSKALTVAEAGIDNTIWKLNKDKNTWTGWTVDTAKGDYSMKAVAFKDAAGKKIGEYDVAMKGYKLGNTTVEVTSYVPNKTDKNKTKRKVRVGVNFAHPLYSYAIDAHNSSKTAGYKLDFSGSGATADAVTGNVYANGNINKSGTATITGTLEATGSISGGSGNSGAAILDPPDTNKMSYATIADVKVADAFNKAGNTKTVTNSGLETMTSAGMNKSITVVKDKTDPAHIFAKDVLNSTGYGPVGTTTNANYYLGDWHESTSGETINVEDSANNMLYYVDGNMWIETNGYGPKLKAKTNGTKMTIVVKGNIYINDLFDYDLAKDGVAFVAINDGETFTDIGNGKFDDGEDYVDKNKNGKWNTGETYTDMPDHKFTAGVDAYKDLNGNGKYDGNAEGSGNIFFGDVNVGPIGTLDGFFYAENNFVDINFKTNGTPQDFVINGNMTAGNQVRINRDFAGVHTKMSINYDNRLMSGALTLKGLPQGSSSIYAGVLYWQEVAAK